MACVYWIHLPEHTDIFADGYVGITTKPVKDRWSGHLCSVKKGSNLPVHNAIRKHREKIVWEVVCICDLDYALWLENKLRPVVYIGWNCGAGGTQTRKGTFASDETKRKNAEASRRRIHTKEEKEKRANSLRGRPVSAETRKKISDANRGRKLSDEQRQRAADTLKAYRGDPESIAKSAKSRSKWRQSSNPEIWEKSLIIYKLWIERKPKKFKSSLLSVFPEISIGSLDRMLRAFKDGWIPTEDKDFNEWVKIYLKNGTDDVSSTI